MEQPNGGLGIVARRYFPQPSRTPGKTDVLREFARGRFPQRQRCGLIEAASVMPAAPGAVGFPQRQRCGLIEA